MLTEIHTLVPPPKLHIKAQSFHFRPKLISVLHIVYINYEPAYFCVFEMDSSELTWFWNMIQDRNILRNALEQPGKTLCLITWLKYNVYEKTTLQLAALATPWV